MDIVKYYNRLNENNKNLIETIDGIAEEKLSIKDNVNEWSVYEILEHIYLTDKIISKLISTPSKNQSDTNEIIGSEELEDVLIGKKSPKVKTPEMLSPKGIINNIQDFKNIFLEEKMEVGSSNY